jgi:hypothetical protein
MRSAILVWFVVGASAAGCKDSSPPDPKPRGPATAPQPAAAKPDAGMPAPPPPTVSARLFIDTSGSMAGFFGASKSQKSAGTMLMAVHEEIDAAMSETGLSSTRKCTVGDNVKCEDVPATPAKLATAGLYHEVTSRLDKVLARAPAPAQIDPNHRPPPDALDDARVTLLITDGMEVASGPGGSAICASGADPTCVRTLLEKRIEEGFGVWLVGVLLPFHGTHFPERTLTPAYFDQARAHVDQLKFDTRNLGVTFAIAGKLGTDPTSGGKSTYTYQGTKPLLIFVFSREPATARAFVGTLVKKLRTAPIQPGKMSPQDAVQTVELAPLAATTTRASRLEIVPQKEQQTIFGDKFDPAKLAELKLQEAARFGGGLAQKLWCGANGRSMLYLRYDQAGERTVPMYVKEQVVLVPAAGLPAGAVAPPTPHGDNRILTGVSCGPIHAGPDTELGFTLETQLALDEPALQGQWWSQTGWSSEDAWQMPERVYRLEDIVLPILKDRVTRPAVWDRVVIHVQRD